MASMTRALLLVAMLAATGCLGAAEEPTAPLVSAPTASEPPAPAPFAAEGVVWLPPSQGAEREVTELAFPVNASGMRGAVDVALRQRYVVDTPPLMADVEVEVLGPDGERVGGAHLRAGSADASVTLEELAAGEHRLVLRSYGGSGGGMGDHVAWRIKVE